MNDRRENTPEEHRDGGSIRESLAAFYREARSTPFQVVVVFVSVAVLGILSRYYGSRLFFRDLYYEQLGSDPNYLLYEYLYWFGSEFLWFFIVPVVLVLTLHRKPISEFGLGFGDWRYGLKGSGIFVLVMLPVLWIASASAEFQAVYPHAQLVKDQWTLFLIYEAGMLVYFIGWEFVWRGYVIFGLKPYTGVPVAILIQMIPFVILHFGKPLPETFGSIAAAIALGALAVRARSFWYCVVVHWSVMISIDLFSTWRYRGAIEGWGFGAIGKLFAFLFS